MQMIGLAGQARVGKNEISDYLCRELGFIRYAFSDPLYEEVAKAYAVRDEAWLMTAMEGELITKEVDCRRFALDQCSDRAFVIRASKLLSSVHPDLGMYDLARKPLSLRWVLQVWGTEYRREQDPEYWIKKADMFIEAYIKSLAHTMTEEIVEQQVREAANEEERVLAEEKRSLIGTTVYNDHPGVVVDGVRFPNEAAWISELDGHVWHIIRPDAPDHGGVANHDSAQTLVPVTGDKMIYNTGTLSQLYTGILMALRGNDIVNTGLTD